MALSANGRCGSAVVPGYRPSEGSEDLDQVSDVLVAGDWIVDREVGVDRVPVATPVPFSRDVPRGGQLDDDPMRSPLGDPHPVTNLSQANAGVVGDADQHLGVIGQKRPARCSVVRHDTRLAFLDTDFML